MTVAEGYEFFFSDFGNHLFECLHRFTFRLNCDEKQEGTENVTKTGKLLRPARIFW